MAIVSGRHLRGRIVAAMFLMLFILPATPVSASSSFPVILSESNGYTKSAYWGMCLDDPGFSKGTFTQMQIYTCNGGSNQRWVSIGGWWSPTWAMWQYQLQNVYSGQCLDVPYNSTQNGTHAVQYPCNFQDPAQRFMWAGWARMQADNGKCLDLPNNNQYNGAKLQFYTCNGSGAQNWNWPW